MPTTTGAAPSAAAPLKRKIAAILAADVAGYSRLVAEDEERTLRDLAAARHVFDRHVAEAGGRIFNTAGDSVMCEFDSAVEAVRVALAIQDAIGLLGAAAPPERRLAFRIGITIGDVVERDGDLLGDGVNVAARLEGVAPAGGICVSRSVHEAVANKIPAVFTDLGPRPVKNIPLPVHAFLVEPIRAASADGPAVKAERRPAAAAAAPRSRRRLAAVAAFFAAIGLGGSAWYLGSGQDRRDRPPENLAATAPTDAGLPESQKQARPPPPARAPSVQPGARPNAEAEKGAGRDRTTRPASPPSAAPPLRDRYDVARAEEAKGDRAAALKAYAALAPLVRDEVDPMLRYASLLRARQGPEGTRKVLEEAGRPAGSRAAQLVAAAQGEPAQQIGRLEAFAAGNPDYAAADFLLAEAYMARSSGPTLTERRLAFDALDRFLDAEDKLPAFFLDRAVLDGWIERARRRRTEVEAFFAGAAGRPVAQFVPTEAGWSARLSLPEPAVKVSLRIGEQGDPLGASVPAGGDRAARTAEVPLPGATGRTTLYVSYLDAAGRDAGPFPIPFDPGAARAAAARETLERFPEAWVSFRPDLPDLLSVAQLASNRCGIAKALIGFGDAPPSQPLTLPACDPRGTVPVAGTGSVVSLPPGTDAVHVQLAYADGTESTVRTFRRP